MLFRSLMVGVIRPAVQRLSAPPAVADAPNPDGPGSAVALPNGTSANGANANSLDNARLLARQDPRIVANVVKNWVAANE